MQDCSTLDPYPGPPVEEDYCATVQMPSEPSLIARGCASLLPPKLHMPKPPVGGAVCVDVNNDDPQQKVSNE